MTETIQTAMDRLMTISVEPQDYVAEDGLLYCGSCKTPKEAFFPNGKKLFGRDRHPAECRCRQATRERRTCKAALRESAAAEAAGLYRLGDAALDICKRSRAKSTDAAGTAVCGPLAGNAGKECGAAALGRCWYRQEFYGGLHCQCPDGTGSGRLHDEFCPNHE